MSVPEMSFGPTARPPRRNAGRADARRYEPTPVYALAEHLKRRGIELENVHGPWRPTRQSLRRPGRKADADMAIPIVTNGVIELAVDTAEHAVDVSGLLNLCGIDHLEPVAKLRPPQEERAVN